MKLLLYDMGTYTQRDIMATLDEMGIEYRNIVYKLKDLAQDAYFEKRVRELLERERYDAVFSVNYFPVLARLCNQEKIPYLSWSYDSPLNIPDIEQTLGLPVNRVFFFDRAECKKYWRKGYENIFHLPLAICIQRLDTVELTEEDWKNYRTDISMVGQLYETSLPVLMQPLSEYDKGYLSAVIETQLKLYGSYFLEGAVTEELLERMNAAYAQVGQNRTTLTKSGLVVAMAKHITHMERLLLLDILSSEHEVQLYGPGTDPTLERVRWRGSADYFEMMPRIFKASKINLNVSLKCIESGIPLRALDIMGCGGFLLTNYQPEIAEHFVDGEELVMYTSLQDAAEKCRYYLAHEAERKEIAEAGYKKVQSLFGYRERLETILKTI